MEYDSSFMSYTTKLNDSSAKIVTKFVFDALHPQSVVDFGCAHGGWLKAWQDNGVGEILGLDGDWVDQNSLMIDSANFRATDLSEGVDLDRTFSIAQCVEVAEHLPASAAEGLVKNLTGHAPVVLFSAAPPGQGGRGHVNEQPYDFWRDLFACHGYHMYDWLRPQLTGRDDVRYWYRYNIFLFAADGHELPDGISATRVPLDQSVRDVSPFLFKVRKRVVRLLPQGIQDRISALLSG